MDGAVAALAPEPWPDAGPIAFPAVQFGRLPAEVTLRLLGRAIACAGNEGPVELAKLEALRAELAGFLSSSAVSTHPGGGPGHALGRLAFQSSARLARTYALAPPRLGLNHAQSWLSATSA